MQPHKQDLKTSSASQPGLLAPDTTGMNFYRADPALTDLLKLHLPEALFRHIAPHLDRLGGLAGGYLDECARLADRHTPVLHQRDKFGRDVQHIEYHPAYREIEKAAFGEFGIHALSIRKGIMGWPDKYPVVAKHAFTFLFNQTEFGMGCPINVTDGCAKLLANFGSEALKAKYLDGLTQTDMSKLTQGGQFMTEKEGGSDVGTLTTRAVQEGDHWRLYGEKWFCSNADAKVVMLLARPEGAGPGTKGVGLFLMPRFLDDGSQNHYRIVRLKDKLGTRSMASGEIKFDGAIAYAVGKLDRGFVQMAEMVNSSRLSNGVKSTALMRRAWHDAITVAKGRVVFGQRIIDLPLARRQLMKIMLPTEQALSMSFLTADALDRAEAGSQDAAALLRILTPTLKFRATRDARKVCGDAMEMRGGIGYIEEFVTPRLLRDAHLGSIWEGTGNIVAIDTLKRAVGRHGADNALAADLHARLDDSPNVPQAWRNRLRDLSDRAIGFAREIASRIDNEGDARRATSLLYHVASAVALAWEGGRIHQMRGDARRLLLSRMVIDHRVMPGDPFRLTENTVQRRMTEHLLGDRAVGMAEVGELLVAA
ncbi:MULTISPECIES: acyl-CoA dehydrogenase family protein [unclassified Bradyrhizobium]|uniref:acyl-CoA dehydrogenase family protein n=1 Tax=unclassified Bradyrhizobium TaxID=2631580 RepID=UPI001BAE0E4F|nr:MULTISPECIES: acyl-CoA dehydrogenase family protein [unclassified Bradyrhizobium]MBR1204771.1 acyl-CoA dehydrogenase family protein [Bradyrhizobium sp. AUGA SZCCT0124]MBR1311857.1 acyl-CoA dehydrogenase family protein [Bradyrhizobium sp. AUGA SZCCT0051]MBR1343587.1 acyl-CoA dehydrogenase family protein [Bradyrhizobium sp. AUGA SZCCT0105]MBR1358128.1 acyl-CoA dehydrogenase family protein [Bradyrhizobium sp. AUGA SZCCT0045]